tara:strand:- start:430 stop:633 length:204 start_codon:yes stop_codon:yes gene_type:complete
MVFLEGTLANNDLKYILENIFKNAYSSGKQDGMNGIHSCPDLVFKHFIDSDDVKKQLEWILTSGASI